MDINISLENAIQNFLLGHFPDLPIYSASAAGDIDPELPSYIMVKATNENGPFSDSGVYDLTVMIAVMTDAFLQSGETALLKTQEHHQRIADIRALFQKSQIPDVVSELNSAFPLLVSGWVSRPDGEAADDTRMGIALMFLFTASINESL